MKLNRKFVKQAFAILFLFHPLFLYAYSEDTNRVDTKWLSLEAPMKWKVVPKNKGVLTPKPKTTGSELYFLYLEHPNGVEFGACSFFVKNYGWGAGRFFKKVPNKDRARIVLNTAGKMMRKGVKRSGAKVLKEDGIEQENGHWVGRWLVAKDKKIGITNQFLTIDSDGYLYRIFCSNPPSEFKSMGPVLFQLFDSVRFKNPLIDTTPNNPQHKGAADAAPM